MHLTTKSEQMHTTAKIPALDVRDYLRILQKRRWLIGTIVAAALLLTVIVSYTTTPMYTASSQVLLERNTGKSGLDTHYYYSYDPEFLETQSEIIRSENVALKVVKNLDLVSKYRQLFFPDETKSAGIGEKIIRGVRSGLHRLGSLFSSDTTTSDSQQGTVTGRIKTDEDIVASTIQAGLKITPIKATRIVNISFQGRDPLVAQLIVDAVVKAYMDEMLEMKLSFSSYSLKWMTEKANEEKRRLESSESGLQKFMRANDLVTVENKLTLLPQKLADFGSQLTKAESEKETLQEQIRLIQSAANAVEKLENLPMFANNEVLKSIREKIYAARQSKQELSNKYGPKHPKMVKINDELRILQDERKAEVDRVVSALNNQYNLALAQSKNLSETLKNAKTEMLDLNERFMQYSTMKRDADSNRVLYDTLQAGIKKESVTEQAQDVNIWVIKKAQRPTQPSLPNKSRNMILGLLAGLLLGLSLSFLLEYLDNTVKTHKDLHERYGLTVLGSIEELREKGLSIDTYLAQKPLSPLAESYRLIRTALLLSSAEHPPRKILITSMSPQEGKTATTINIARVLAQSASRVLVIDCDLRRPRMSSVLGVDRERGLSSYLAGNHDDRVVVEIPGEQIFFMPSGPVPPNPAELLGSKRMQLLVAQLAEEYDFVLLDSPPVQSVTDSLALSHYVDGTILVIRGGKTTFELLDSGIRKLIDVNARLLGFVLNCVKGSDSGNYYYGYSSYYAKDDD